MIDDWLVVAFLIRWIRVICCAPILGCNTVQVRDIISSKHNIGFLSVKAVKKIEIAIASHEIAVLLQIFSQKSVTLCDAHLSNEDTTERKHTICPAVLFIAIDSYSVNIGGVNLRYECRHYISFLSVKAVKRIEKAIASHAIAVPL